MRSLFSSGNQPPEEVYSVSPNFIFMIGIGAFGLPAVPREDDEGGRAVDHAALEAPE